MIHRDSLRQIILALQDLGNCQPMSRQRLLSGDPAQIAQIRNVEAVNKLLRQYEARPRLRLPSPLGGGIRLAWRCAGKDIELNAVLVAVELARQGRIASLKKCPNSDCKRWLFAKFAHSRFCSEDCKNTFHRENPDEKKRRQEWARNNYWLQKNKNVK